VVDGLALGILALLSLNWLQLMTTGWEWADTIVLRRPGWTYPVSVLVIGATFAHLALYATRRIGAATAIALVSLAAHAPIVALFRLYLPPGPIIAAHVLLVPTAVALDTWYALRTRDQATTGEQTRMTLWSGTLLYTAVFFAVALPYIAYVTTVPLLNPTATLASVAIGLLAVVIASLISARIGAWLGEVGHVPASDMAPHPEHWSGRSKHGDHLRGPSV
jgi:hypothetical protein